MLSKLFKRRSAYRQVFLGPNRKLTAAAAEVVADLRKFCWLGNELSPDPYALALAEGRRQVFWRLVRYLEMEEPALSVLQEGEGHE